LESVDFNSEITRIISELLKDVPEEQQTRLEQIFLRNRFNMPRTINVLAKRGHLFNTVSVFPLFPAAVKKTPISMP